MAALGFRRCAKAGPCGRWRCKFDVDNVRSVGNLTVGSRLLVANITACGQGFPRGEAVINAASGDDC